MTAELSSAIAAALVAIAAWLRFEVERRRLELRQEQHERRLTDVQHKVGADRRSEDCRDARKGDA